MIRVMPYWNAQAPARSVCGLQGMRWQAWLNGREVAHVVRALSLFGFGFVEMHVLKDGRLVIRDDEIATKRRWGRVRVKPRGAREE